MTEDTEARLRAAVKELHGIADALCRGACERTLPPTWLAEDYAMRIWRVMEELPPEKP